MIQMLSILLLQICELLLNFRTQYMFLNELYIYIYIYIYIYNLLKSNIKNSGLDASMIKGEKWDDKVKICLLISGYICMQVVINDIIWI